MSIETLYQSKPIARKEHKCMASEWLLNFGFPCNLSFSELRTIAIAKRNNWKVQPGEKYIRQNNKFDGELYTYKAIQAMHDICVDHDLFD